MAGCTISPLAFTLAMDLIIRASAWVVGGERVDGGLRLPPIRTYMDDMTTITSTKPCTKRLLEKLQSNISWAGMKIKPCKSRSISVVKGQITNDTFTINDEPIIAAPALRTGKKWTPKAAVADARAALRHRDIVGHVQQGGGGFGLGVMAPTWGKASPAERRCMVVEEIRRQEEASRVEDLLSESAIWVLDKRRTSERYKVKKSTEQEAQTSAIYKLRPAPFVTSSAPLGYHRNQTAFYIKRARTLFLGPSQIAPDSLFSALRSSHTNSFSIRTGRCL
ncbi:hypothetical protein SRHO_G00064870 [Serrasalmus rhombeus]